MRKIYVELTCLLRSLAYIDLHNGLQQLTDVFDYLYVDYSEWFTITYCCFEILNKT